MRHPRSWPTSILGQKVTQSQTRSHWWNGLTNKNSCGKKYSENISMASTVWISFNQFHTVIYNSYWEWRIFYEVPLTNKGCYDIYVDPYWFASNHRNMFVGFQNVTWDLLDRRIDRRIKAHRDNSIGTLTSVWVEQKAKIFQTNLLTHYTYFHYSHIFYRYQFNAMIRPNFATADFNLPFEKPIR